MNNLVRSVVGGIAGALCSGPPNCNPPYDEPLGLGWSLEAIQLSEDAVRILQNEARLTEVIDPQTAFKGICQPYSPGGTNIFLSLYSPGRKD